VRRASLLGKACSLLVALGALLGTTPARADGSYPGSRQILLPADRPEQLILATNFGLILSEDAGETWSFSCERELSAYAGPYLLGAAGSRRIFALTAGAGLIHSDDDSCGWHAAGGALSDVLPYAFAVDPSSAQRVYAIGVPRQDLRNGDSIYVSDDGGVSFGPPVFTAPARSALLSVLVAPSRPRRLLATLFSTPQNHPSLLRSDDSGEHWEEIADLVDALGENPFELLAIDPLDENKLYARVLGASAETLAISDDGGLSFVQSVSIPGKLNALLRLASGTLLVAGTAGTQGVGYRSHDGGQTFEAWSAAPHVHALAERSGKLYVAGDSYADGYALAESDDEGESLRPLLEFKQVQALKACVAEACAESCAYYAGIGLWPASVCGAPREPLPTAPSPDPEPLVPGPREQAVLRASGGGCACNLGHGWPAGAWQAPWLIALAAIVRRRAWSSARRK
jgi:hypothetical protein